MAETSWRAMPLAWQVWRAWRENRFGFVWARALTGRIVIPSMSRDLGVAPDDGRGVGRDVSTPPAARQAQLDVTGEGKILSTQKEQEAQRERERRARKNGLECLRILASFALNDTGRLNAWKRNRR